GAAARERSHHRLADNLAAHPSAAPQTVEPDCRTLSLPHGLERPKATSRTSPTMWLLSGFVALSMLGSFTMLAYQSIANMERTLGSVQVRDDRPANAPRQQRARLQRLPAAPGSVLSSGVLQGAAFTATLLLVAALLIAVASRDIARPEWDLEWLITLPLP